ncbi:MAG: ribosome silencing factor [Bacteroidia bacterium]|nr:ribosome silencing factor [Bacteroidia bacterium]
MTKSTKKTSKPALLESIIDAVKEKKGKDIVVVDLREITSRVCDYFVICNADSNVHVQSIARGVEDNVRILLAEKPFSKEGLTNSQWVLIDYVSVVVHVLETSFREYYNLEGLWADATITHHASDE